MTPQENPEKNIDYYHARFAEITELIAEGKWDELKKGKERVERLIEDYKKDFPNNPNYIDTHIAAIGGILKDLK